MMIQSLLHNNIVTANSDLNKVRIDTGLLTYRNKKFRNQDLTDLFVNATNTLKEYVASTVANFSSIKDAGNVDTVGYIIANSLTENNYAANKKSQHDKTVTFEDDSLLIEVFYYAKVAFAHTFVKESGLHSYQIFPRN